ncbi:MAG: type II methionyl aminopeptidase, partial [Nanoarchaeota archaeon]|nr:type II methionyl aminopeptidase [Nanoarchaeota archaeon]
GLGIPNYDNKDKSTLKEGMVVAIEPFFTDGVGYVIEKGEPKIFRVVKKGRVGRELLKRLEKEYHSLPFSKFWVKDPRLSLLCREGTLKAYPPLVEKSGGMVSQFEHTLIVGGKVTTK